MPDNRIEFPDDRRRFLAETADHVMTVEHDDGLYRHLRFQKPGTGFYHFNLVTWPGHLAITGDVDSFTFSRVPDMFEFFGGNVERINPSYWAEKLVAKSDVLVHSPEQFVERVVSDFWERRHGFDDTAEIFRMLRSEVLEDRYYADSAHAALLRFQYVTSRGRAFHFNDTWEWDFNEYSGQFLWALHAITWGIGQYQASKVPAVAHA
ncbi:hypothetical protein ACFXG4_04815 [Nocardia sp. NPDC059246]|uniref:hypothetical protein n=1 Tax=unclassified Nocardia TaxID=2637762 RepID=UPI0036A70597